MFFLKLFHFLYKVSSRVHYLNIKGGLLTGGNCNQGSRKQQGARLQDQGRGSSRGARLQDQGRGSSRGHGFRIREGEAAGARLQDQGRGSSRGGTASAYLQGIRSRPARLRSAVRRGVSRRIMFDFATKKKFGNSL